ncbi:hypothetical protein [Shewanella sp. GutDb-MelDb]|uniref:hypothetical protein n=1 Tax=Shewanella sp. GutDb-MelDb TaxID=2058316 RepID=UPI000C7C0AF1|nr:hypothetical protein [Shewanella sp. GutDb-MelDb]PKG55417.1 hypothetical protein CXF82_20440 [Shewanella sp. GutDb-MelDb]
MKKILFKIFTCSLLAMMALMNTAVAADAKPDSLADVWVMVPNHGQESAFETAFIKHVQFRASQGDPRAWKVYRPTIGTGMDRYIIRYCCTQWNDVDGYQKWQADNKILDDWYANVAQYIHHYEHFYSRLDIENSNWPQDSEEFKYFAVTNYREKMGSSKGIAAGKKLLSDNAKAMKWPYSWSWADSIGGEGGLSLVIPYNNYAGMTPPDKSFAEVLATHMGDEAKAGAALKAWSDNFHSTTYTVYRLVDELSMKDK